MVGAACSSTDSSRPVVRSHQTNNPALDSSSRVGKPEEIPAALRMVSASEAAGLLIAEEADAWRMLLAEWYGYQSLGADPLSAERFSVAARNATAGRFILATLLMVSGLAAA